MTSRQHAPQAAEERAQNIVREMRHHLRCAPHSTGAAGHSVFTCNDDCPGCAEDKERAAIIERHIAAALAEQEAEQWIDVRETDKLPKALEGERPVEVLILTTNTRIWQAHRRDEWFEASIGGQRRVWEIGREVTHWRALPAPPANTTKAGS